MMPNWSAMPKSESPDWTMYCCGAPGAAVAVSLGEAEAVAVVVAPGVPRGVGVAVVLTAGVAVATLRTLSPLLALSGGLMRRKTVTSVPMARARRAPR